MLQLRSPTVPALLREVEGAPEEEGTLPSHDVEEIKRSNLALREVSHSLIPTNIRQRSHVRVPEWLAGVGVALQREELRQYLYFCAWTCVSTVCFRTRTFGRDGLQQVGVAVAL